MRTRGALVPVLVFAAVTLAARVSSAAAPEVVPPQRLDTAEAAYPPDGKGDARVVLAIVVDATGAVTEVKVREGASPFAEAATVAAKGWRFAPATRDETPIIVRVLAEVLFHAPLPPKPVMETLPSAPLPSGPPAAKGTVPAPAPVSIEVAVRGEHEELGTTHIARTETRFIPGAFADPFRVVEALPGMAPWLSGLPYFYVRGSAPENVGYMIDGIRVPLLFHVGAGPSTIAPALVNSVDLFPGAYPARYGRFAGAIIAGETTPPNEERAHGEFQVRVFDAGAFIETPIDKGRGTLMAAGRYGYTGLVTSLVAPNYSIGYWDYQVRASHRLAGRDQLTLFAFGARDELDYKGAPTFRVAYHRADLRYDHPISGGNVRIGATFSYDDTLTALQTQTGAGASAALKAPGGKLRAEIDEHVSSTAWIRGGADIGVSRFTVDEYSGINHGPHTDVVGGVHADVVWAPTSRVEIVPGLRLDGYRARDTTTFAPQPRLSVKIKITRTIASISAAGMAHQEPTDEVFVPAKLPNVIDESPRDSYQFSQGFEVRLPSSIRVKATGFYSKLLAASVSGMERSAGLEVFLHRDFSQRLGGFISYTLSRSDTTLNGLTFRSNGDRTHLLSVVLGYDLGANWRAGARFFFESGRLYQAVCQGPDCPSAQSLSGNLPPFFRLDARLEKKWFFAGGQWLAGTLECFNTLDKAEAINANYVPDRGVVINHQPPIILPSIGVEGGF